MSSEEREFFLEKDLGAPKTSTLQCTIHNDAFDVDYRPRNKSC